MEEGGIVIFEDGEILSFGKYVPPDHPQYHNIPGHEKSFHNEVIPSFAFKLSNHDYNDRLNLYQNILKLSLDGMIIIINNQQSITAKTEVMSYVPSNPTDEQLNSLKDNDKLLKIEIQKVYEFASFDFDDYLEYEGFQDYINSKSIQKS